MSIGFRDHGPGDVRFIRHSWVQSFRISHYAGMSPMENYYETQHRWIQKLMDRDDVCVLVAFNTDHESQIYGFLCTEGGFTLPVVHYVYVKSDFRRLPQKDDSFKKGIATMLLAPRGINQRSPFYYTYKPGDWAGLAKHGQPFSGGMFRPLFARFDKYEAIRHEKEQVARRKSRRKSKPLRVEYKCT